MGQIERLRDGQRRALAARSLVGRSPACLLRIERVYVSAEHAVVAWLDGAWSARDLGSRNGTRVGDRRVAAGETATLDEGVVLCFGDPDERWCLVDAAAPEAFAQRSDGEQVHAEGGVLRLPAAAVTIARGGPTGWRALAGDAWTAVEDGGIIEADGDAWTLRLPTPLEATMEVLEPTVGGIRLRFGVSRDEEYVEVGYAFLGQVFELATRSYTYMLLTLARLRQRDAEEEALPAAEHGWIHQDDLASMIGTDPATLNVWISRARRQLVEAGVENGKRLIERRRGTGQIRLGCHRIEIRSL